MKRNKVTIEGRIKTSEPKPKLAKYWEYKTIHKDPYDPRYYLTVEMFVPIPSRDSPFPCILVNLYNSKGRVFFRIVDLKELLFFANIDPEEVENCSMAMKLANSEANKILEVNREIEHRKRLPEGVRVVYYNEQTKEATDPDTGEILKERKEIYRV